MVRDKKIKKTVAPKGGTEAAQDAPQDGGRCRCKEVARKTPAELVKTMLEDLAFWKNGKTGKSSRKGPGGKESGSKKRGGKKAGF